MPVPVTVLWLDRCLTGVDNTALYAAVRHARQHQQPLLAFVSTHREMWLSDYLPTTPSPNSASLMRLIAAFDARQQLAQQGVQLRVTDASPCTVITALCQESAVSALFTDDHADTAKSRLLNNLSRSGLAIKRLGSNTLLDAEQRLSLPDHLMGRFTKFYHRVKDLPIGRDAQNRSDESSLSIPTSAAWPTRLRELHDPSPGHAGTMSVLPVTQHELASWWQEYVWDQKAIAHYKTTRNQPDGRYAFSRLSAALALGTLSPRDAVAQIQQFEDAVLRNASTQWLTYELYWREYFHWAGKRLGPQLFQAPVATLNPRQQEHLVRWCQGETEQELVNAGMHELLATGFISNRLRQLVASYLVHELNVPWQYGAAWFEQQLIDFDVNSNYGNWAYITGNHPLSAQPHRFDLEWQTTQHDPEGRYRAKWCAQR